MTVRRTAVAGTWYPGSAEALRAAVDGHLAAVAGAARAPDHLVALVAPHAGLIYSGPVAAHAYRLLQDRPPDLIVLAGPSHSSGFDGVAAFRGAGFETPLGLAPIDAECTESLMRASAIVRDYPAAHVREHSLEMQLPFIRRVAPDAKIVALVMGWQTPATARELGDALGRVLKGRNAVIVASTDLSHYEDADTAARLDAVVIDHVARLDADGLQRALDARPEHACGGGPAVAVMRAARQLGADTSVVLKYADSGDVSGDKSAVVGYLAAAIGSNDVGARGARTTNGDSRLP
jgi:MEMO1 family protein